MLSTNLTISVTSKSSNNRLDFSGDPAHDVNKGIWKYYLGGVGAVIIIIIIIIIECAPTSEHSRLHKRTPLWTILRTHSRCVETKVVGRRSSSIGAMSALVDLRGVANPLEDDNWWLLEGCASGLVMRSDRCPNRRSRLFLRWWLEVDLFYASLLRWWYAPYMVLWNR